MSNADFNHRDSPSRMLKGVLGVVGGLRAAPSPKPTIPPTSTSFQSELPKAVLVCVWGLCSVHTATLL